MVQACLIYAACGSSNLPSAFAKKIMFQRTCWSERQTSWEKTCVHNHSIFNFEAEETLAFCFAPGTRGPRVWFSTQNDLIGIVFFSAELANRKLSIFQSEKLFSFCFLSFISPFTKKKWRSDVQKKYQDWDTYLLVGRKIVCITMFLLLRNGVVRYCSELY